MLDSIWSAVSSIPNKIQELATSVGEFFSNFWSSFTQGLSDVVSGIGEFFTNLGTNLANWFSDVGTWFSELGSDIGSWFSDLWDTTKNIFSWLGNFFQDLWDFFIHIFVPTDEQWNDIGNDYTQMGDTVKSHIPFVGLFSEELKKAQETVSKTDFLVITIPSFNYTGSGGIGVNTSEQKVINVGQAYEPYRSYVRGGLLLIVVGLAFVYIIRYILNYGTTQGGSNVIEGQTSFFDKGGK